MHPRERLKRKNQLKKDPKVEYVKTVLVHPRDKLSRKIRNAPAKIFVDERVLKELPYFNTKIKIMRQIEIKEERLDLIKLSNNYLSTTINIIFNMTKTLILIEFEKKKK